jgi:hypothetical protein
VPRNLTFKYPQLALTVRLYYIQFLQRTAAISLKKTEKSAFLMEKLRVFLEVGTELINTAGMKFMSH